jgi:hypothetical protein
MGVLGIGIINSTAFSLLANSNPKVNEIQIPFRTVDFQSPNKMYDYEDDEKEMGASCFTHRVRTTAVPKGFKLPHYQQKYDGSQEPQSWLSDYQQAVKILGGTKEIAMQSL